MERKRSGIGGEESSQRQKRQRLDDSSGDDDRSDQDIAVHASYGEDFNSPSPRRSYSRSPVAGYEVDMISDSSESFPLTKSKGSGVGRKRKERQYRESGMSRASRGRGRGQGRGARGRRDAGGPGFTYNTKRLLIDRADSMSDTSSLGEVSLTSLCKVDISKESTFMKRLFKEYVEIRNNPLQNVSLSPLTHDFTTWHGNIRAPQGTPYEGGVFHFSINFPTKYPMVPPKITMLTRIEHPCVLYDYIILDFLQVPMGTRRSKSGLKNSQRYQTWSPAYTVSSIMIQLQAVLFDGTAETALQDLTDLSEYTERRRKWESGVKFSVEQSLRYSCSACKHRPRSYWPPLEACVQQAGVSLESIYLEDAVCALTRKSNEEAALGMGISFNKDLRTGRISTVHCVPDIISLNAYKSKDFDEIWGQGFTHWMPIYLHHSHGERALYLTRRSLSTMYAGNPNEFEASMVLDFFPRILCHLAVSFANADEGGDALRVLHAYCYMHRLFLQFLKEQPGLVASAKDKVKEFIQDEAKRHLEHTTAIGHIVILATFTGVLWAELAPSYLAEGFDRQVSRIIQKHPELNTSKVDPKIDATRITKSFQSVNLSGLRFLMTQLMFNRYFVCPEGSSFEYVINQYDKHSSLVTKELEDVLLEEKKAIVAVNSFSGFLAAVGQRSPSDEELLETLRTSVANSQRKRYHGDKGIEVLSPEEFEKQRLGAIRPLEEMMEGSHLHGNEDQWKALCETRFGLTELPSTYSADVLSPWKHLYLQHNLQELVSKLNDNPDFQLLYKTLELSKDTLTHFDLVTFRPDNIKSHYFFLSRILELLPLLTHLTISKGEIGLGEKGFKELVKGMTKSSGALQVLDIRHLGIEESHVSKLAEGHLTSEGLRCLNLEGNLLRTEGTVKLSQLMLKHSSLPNLAELSLKACQITDSGMKALAEGLLVKRRIRKIDLSKNQFTHTGLAEVLKSLSYNPVLEELLVTGCTSSSNASSVLSAALAKLFELTISLRKVSFWNTRCIAVAFDAANLKQLAKNTTIADLDLGSMSLSVTAANENFGEAFTSRKSALSILCLEKSKFTVDCCNRLNEQAKGKTSPITDLNLSGSDKLFTTRQLKKEKIAKVMLTFFSKTFGNLTHLNVSRCKLDSDEAEVFGAVLSKNTPLKELDLSFNQLGKHGARFLANGLSSNTNLDVLKLDKNSLGAAGAHYIAAVLAQPSCTLKQLHLFCNYIDVPGTTAICKALETNKHLQYIDLGMNKVRKRGAAAVISMLASNSSLKTICLKFNFIPDSWAVKLVKQLVEVPSCHVTSIKLAGNSLEHETLVTIVTILKESAREVDFDLSARAEYRIPERMERTVYISPLAANVTPQMVKKMFYQGKCGAIKSVKIERHKKKKTSFAKSMYALVEFAHRDSVELAVDLMKKKEARVGYGTNLLISRAGLSTGAAAHAAAKSVGQPMEH